MADRATREQLVEKVASAMFDAWPIHAVSPALAEKAGVPIGTPLTWDQVIEMGGDHNGLLRLARAAIASLSSPSDETLRGALEGLIASCTRTKPGLHDDCGTRIVTAPSVEALKAARAALSRTAEPREKMVERNFAWTPGAGAYKHYPQYVNLTGNKLTVRGPEFVNGDGHPEMGPTVSIELPDGVLRDFAAALSANNRREDVVERVARAIFAAGFSENEDSGVIDQCWNNWTEHRERAFREARAALSALPAQAKPSEDMRDEAFRRAKLCDGDHASTCFEYGWDAALAAMLAAAPLQLPDPPEQPAQPKETS